jgi:hypothetical protein
MTELISSGVGRCLRNLSATSACQLRGPLELELAGDKCALGCAFVASGSANAAKLTATTAVARRLTDPARRIVVGA